MYNEIMDGVVKKLNELFPEAVIGTVPMGEGLDKPYFEVGLLETSEKPVNSQRYLRLISLYIKYYGPDSEQMSRDRNLVLDVLMDRMEYITLDNGSLIRGSSRSGNNEKDFLNVLVSYQIYILKTEEPDESMEDIKLQ